MIARIENIHIDSPRQSNYLLWYLLMSEVIINVVNIAINK
jgi:hypothetical protein